MRVFFLYERLSAIVEQLSYVQLQSCKNLEKSPKVYTMTRFGLFSLCVFGDFLLILHQIAKLIKSYFCGQFTYSHLLK